MRDQNYIYKLISKINADALDREEAAGMSGSYGDNGASKLREQTNFFLAGINFAESGILPVEWEDYTNQLDKETDPEYQTYIELKKKFEHK